jgi:hypothetical protein
VLLSVAMSISTRANVQRWALTCFHVRPLLTSSRRIGGAHVADRHPHNSVQIASVQNFTHAVFIAAFALEAAINEFIGPQRRLETGTPRCQSGMSSDFPSQRERTHAYQQS